MIDPRNQKLGVLFLLLLVATLVRLQPWQGDAHQRTQATYRPMFPDLIGAEEEVASITIQSEGTTTTLELGYDRGLPHWMVRERFGHPADLMRMQTLLKSMQALRTRDVEAEEASSHQAYGVADGQGTRIIVRDDQGGVRADLFVGDLRGQDVQAGQVPVLEFFLRPAGQDKVYRAGDFHVPSAKPATWCDTRFLLAVETDQIRFFQRIDEVGGQSWNIVRAPVQVGGWRMVAPESAEVAEFAADSWLYTLTGLRAAEVLGRSGDAAVVQRFGQVSDRFRVGIGEHEFVLELGRSLPGDLRAARVGGLNFVYALAQHDADQLRQSVAAMLRED